MRDEEVGGFVSLGVAGGVVVLCFRFLRQRAVVLWGFCKGARARTGIRMRCWVRMRSGTHYRNVNAL